MLFRIPKLAEMKTGMTRSSSEDTPRKDVWSWADKEQTIVGPWIHDIQDHPFDIYEWEEHGYQMQIIRDKCFWTWCGYVTLPVGHPLAKCSTMSSKLDHILVPGGISFSRGHTYGFDSNHSWDYTPGIVQGEPSNYNTFDFVCKAVISMATQFKLESDYPSLEETIVTGFALFHPSTGAPLRAYQATRITRDKKRRVRAWQNDVELKVVQ